MITKFEKTMTETYNFSFDDPSCMWARIMITPEGDFNVQSDNENFSYSWRAFGDNFKTFIIKSLTRDTRYLLGKISECNVVDFDKTMYEWKKNLGTAYRDREITMDQLKECLWDIEHDFNSLMSKDELCIRMVEDSKIGKYFDEPWYIFEVKTRYPYGAEHFAKVVMPEFAKILRDELTVKDC